MFSFGSKPRVPAVATGVTAPTTATVGQLGDVRFDADGNRWELIAIVGGLYYWALPPDVYPALDTEYFLFYDTRLSKAVYKMAKETVTAASGGVVSTAHGILGFSRIYEQTNAFMINSIGNNFGNYYASSTDSFTAWVNATNCQTNTPNTVALSSKPVYFKFKYIKV